MLEEFIEKGLETDIVEENKRDIERSIRGYTLCIEQIYKIPIEICDRAFIVS